MNKYFNPFQTQELRFPSEYRESVEKFTQTRGTGATSPPSRSPFPRMVDIWWLAVCVGANRGKREQVPRDKMHKFIEGSILSSDPWRVEQLCLLAIGFTGNAEVLRNPADLIQLANDLAAGGMPIVLEWLQSGRSDPIWNLSDRIAEGGRTPRPPAEGTP